MRVLGEEPDEVSIEIRVSGRRAREVASNLAGNALYPTEVIPVRIGVPGLDRITGGLLSGVDLDVGRLGEEVEFTFTIMATVEEEPA
jgi:hypothetical protein